MLHVRQSVDAKASPSMWRREHLDLPLLCSYLTFSNLPMTRFQQCHDTWISVKTFILGVFFLACLELFSKDQQVDCEGFGRVFVI